MLTVLSQAYRRQSRTRLWFTALCVCWFSVEAVRAEEQPAAVTPDVAAAEQLFRTRVAPIFQRRCLNCHNAVENKGDFSLETAESAFAGGPSGEPITAGKPDESLLLELITPENGKAAMPQKADPLRPEEIAVIREWIAAGATWPAGYRLQEPVVEAKDWWSLRPLKQPALPQIPPERQAWVRNPIDQFVAAQHVAQGLRPAVEADRRTLIRRLSFDLTGLPPTLAEVTAFLEDQDPHAYEKLVDRLLASPRYGERWARHWLDVVHFGETHGYDKDQPRPNAWPYRDYVIRSFNSDKPYSRFVQEQVAGDVLFPGTVDGVEALGFIAAGPWDLIGHAEVPESKTDGLIARHLDRDDMVANTINTFCSLTVHCAQCHNHKFDPITQADYYALQAVFAALDRADKPYDRDPELQRRRGELTAQHAAAQGRLRSVEQRVAEMAGPELAALEQQITAAGRKVPDPAPPEHGYHSQIEPVADRVKWVQVDLGTSSPFEKLEVVACYDDFNNIGAGFGFPLRFKLETSDDATFQAGVRVLVDRTREDFANPLTAPVVLEVPGSAGRYVRLTATRLAPRQNDFILALSELKVFDAQGKNLALKAPVTALDTIEALPRWSVKNLVDGIHPGPTVDPQQQRALLARKEALLNDKVSSELRQELAAQQQAFRAIDQEFRALPAPSGVVYAGTIHYGGGNFTGTGPRGGTPRPIHILRRGDVKQPAELITPGTITALDFLPTRFEAEATQPEGARRAALARWITSPENPLIWRSIVNRVWLYHFGRGLVDTPNDFGHMGQLPSHPELLDWLAFEFRAGDQSLKGLHKLMVLSATYRQSAMNDDPRGAEIDVANAYLWKMNRRRLEAEAVRDALLLVSGTLREEMGGPSFRDFIIEKPEHSPHYQYHLHDADNPASHRRSIYRFLVRSQQQPFMATWDCADPSMLVDKRNQTITPLQALALLNNQLTVVMSRHFAERVAQQAATPAAQVRLAVQLALAREPTSDEQRTLEAFAAQHGLRNLCRVLLNLNEFVFVD